MLTESNYYQSKEYMSASLFKQFYSCPACALATLKGEYEPPRGRALLLGSFVDEFLTGTEESRTEFLERNADEIYKKRGGVYADIEQAQEAVALVMAQPLMMKYLSGEHQRIMTGEIEGVPVKIKMDSYKPGEFIADLKYMKSLRAPNLFENIIKYWHYDIQAYFYREIVRQNTGETLPFYFVMATKEDPPHLAVAELNEGNLEDAERFVKANIARYWDMVKGKADAERCEEYDCKYCTSTVKLTEPVDTDLLGMSAKQIKLMRGEIL